MKNINIFLVLMLTPLFALAQSAVVVPAQPAQSGKYQVVKSLGETVLGTTGTSPATTDRDLGPVTFVSNGELTADTSGGFVKFSKPLTAAEANGDYNNLAENSSTVILVRDWAIGNWIADDPAAMLSRADNGQEPSLIQGLDGTVNGVLHDSSALIIGYGDDETKHNEDLPEGIVVVDRNSSINDADNLKEGVVTFHVINAGLNPVDDANADVEHFQNDNEDRAECNKRNIAPSANCGFYINMGTTKNANLKLIPQTSGTSTTNIFDGKALEAMQWRNVKATAGPVYSTGADWSILTIR